MSDEREYIVSLHRGVDAEQFNQEMIANTGAGAIPGRSVDVADARPGSYRNTHYALTDAEAEELAKDPRVYGVEIPPEQRDDIRPMPFALEEANFNKSTSPSGNYRDWGKIRHSYVADQYNGGTTTSANWPYALDGAGVDVVIQDSGLQVDHPEFIIENTAEYTSTAVASDSSNGAVFDRSLTVHGIKIVVAGAVGGQTAVPNTWAEKTGKVIQLLIDPTANGINLQAQKKLIATLKGDTGTTHAGLPTAQRVGYGGGDSYNPNWLTDAGAAQYSGYTDFLDSHVVNDMVWYKNTSGPDPSTSDRDIEEIMEHLFHTIHNFGIPGAVGDSATQVPMESLIPIMDNNPSFDWQNTALHLAMKEAIDAGLYDPSGYATDWATDYEAAVVAYKEYTYLVNWSMWDMSQFWDGGSLSPEWDDTLKTRQGMRANNPLGHALFVKYFQPVLSKPSFTTLQAIFQDNDAGDSQYTTSSSGYNRVQQIDWATESGLPFTQSSNHYRDTDGHGTHCAGTAAGLNFGWAKNARVYSVKVAGLEGSGDSGTGISTTYVFDCIKLWHRNKPVDPVTGVKRPTIVNMSWGYGGYYQFNTATDSIVYRGTTYSGTSTDTVTKRRAYGLAGISYGSFNGSPYYRYNSRITSVDTDIQELTDEGVHVCIAAGNYYYLRDLSTGLDYNNIAFAQVYNFGSATFNAGSFYYHRGGSPYGVDAFTVGNQNSTYTFGTERPADSSEKGPAVDIYAAGTSILSCTSNTNKFSDASYYANPVFRQCNISGTSMASPQVCGVGALYLQANPELSPVQLKEMIARDSIKNELNDTGATSYADFDSIMGGNNRILYNKYAVQNPYTTSASGTNVGLSE